MTQSLNEDLQEPPMIRKVKLSEIQGDATKSITLSEAERAVIMDLLDLKDLKDLDFTYRLRSGAGGRVYLTGRLKAGVTQTCVVSLEPVAAEIDVPVEAAFWPPAKIAELEKRAEDPNQSGEIDWPEAIEGDAIDLGPLVYETLATSLDPYPKKEGAQFEWSEADSEAENGGNGPFAALKQLKDR